MSHSAQESQKRHLSKIRPHDLRDRADPSPACPLSRSRVRVALDGQRWITCKPTVLRRLRQAALRRPPSAYWPILRTAIANSRLAAFDDDRVAFSDKDYRRGGLRLARTSSSVAFSSRSFPKAPTASVTRLFRQGRPRRDPRARARPDSNRASQLQRAIVLCRAMGEDCVCRRADMWTRRIRPDSAHDVRA
jgi:hypothetical protein